MAGAFFRFGSLISFRRFSLREYSRRKALDEIGSEAHNHEPRDLTNLMNPFALSEARRLRQFQWYILNPPTPQ